MGGRIVTIRLRRFNDEGLRQLVAGVEQLRNTGSFDPESILGDDDLTETLEGALVTVPNFGNRYAMATYLTPIVQGAGRPNAFEDRGLWSWIAAAWLKALVGGDIRKLGQPYRWILQNNAWQAYYRHLFAGPCAIVAQHSDDPSRCRVLLTTELLHPGAFYDDAASQQRTIRSPGLLEAMTAIYLDEFDGLRSGATGPHSQPGSIRRFTRHLDRLELTYDLQSISADALLDEDQRILPDEFRHLGAAVDG